MAIEIPEDDSKYMYNFIDRIIKEVGPRIPCSQPEAQAAEIIQKELKNTCDEVKIEPFTCHPRGFLGWIKFDILLIIASLLSYFFLIPLSPIGGSILALIPAVIAIIIAWYEFFNYDEFVDRFFKEKPSQNVVGTIKPTGKGEIKKILIFSGHHDSALQFNLLRYLKHGYFIIIFLAVIILFLWLALTGLNLILTVTSIVDRAWFNNLAIWLLIIGCPAFVGMFFFVSGDKRANTVPGAVDNLSAVAVVLGLGRYIKAHQELIPPNTEIRLVSFGCEEAGLRGAYRYVEAHLAELNQFNAEDVNMDGIMTTKNIMVIEKEPTTRTTHSKEVAEKLQQAAKAINIPIQVFGGGLLALAALMSGGTDATAFSKAKVKAASLASMELLKFPYFYHQPSDTLDMIEPGSLEVALKILISYLRNESKP
ncbi:MAG: M28 family metallopeptidase [Candidatus Helarchaeota archaeon]|nr:M28 family metallopeptidase [Candidatus Helarchaeota archaeon]